MSEQRYGAVAVVGAEVPVLVQRRAVLPDLGHKPGDYQDRESGEESARVRHQSTVSRMRE